MTVTIHIYYIILIIVLLIVLFLILHLRLTRVRETSETCTIQKNLEVGELSKKILTSSEDNLNLFFKFEAAILENIRLARITKTTMKELKTILSEIRLSLEQKDK